jgi:phosphoserine aminotransferase
MIDVVAFRAASPHASVQRFEWFVPRSISCHAPSISVRVPAALPEEVLRQAREECLEWGEARASVMEISHRGNAFVSLAAEAERDLRELLRVPPNYKVLFLQGGRNTAFCADPDESLYAQTRLRITSSPARGVKKAVSEGTPYVDARVVVDMQATGYTDVPDSLVGLLNPSASYVHYTPQRNHSWCRVS